MEKDEKIIGCLNSAFVCDNNCGTKGEYIDNIDSSVTFNRNMECSHYQLNLVRRRKQNKITLRLNSNAKYAKKTKKKFLIL